MKLSNKRQADGELQSARASKRQAATLTRMTRSTYKLLRARNEFAVELNPGLTTTLRPRKKAPTKPSIANAQKQRIQEANPNPAGSGVELEVLPSTTDPLPAQPALETAPLSSIIDALDRTSHVHQTVAPISLGSDARSETTLSETAIAKRSSQTLSEGAFQSSAAGLSGPAPIAHMGLEFPLTITYTDGEISEPKTSQLQTRRRREHSHSSQISPKSGPAQVCSPPTASLPISPKSDPTQVCPPHTTSLSVSYIAQDWNSFTPGWLFDAVDIIHDLDMSLCKTQDIEHAPAVLEAMYTVESPVEVIELIASEMAAQESELCSDPDVVEIAVNKFPVDIFKEEKYFEQMRVDSEILTVSDNDDMEWTGGNNNADAPEHGPDIIMSEDTLATQCSEIPLSSSTTAEQDSSPCRNMVPTVEPAASVTPKQSAVASLPLPLVAPYMPRPTQTDAQKKDNALREKELRAQLIKVRQARRRMQNILVRATDGSLSIAAIEQDPTVSPSWAVHWFMEEDQYSVEEYDEDTVSY